MRNRTLLSKNLDFSKLHFS